MLYIYVASHVCIVKFAILFSRVPGDIVTVAKLLSRYLGQDSESSRKYISVLMEYGHPLPYRNEAVFNVEVSTCSVCVFVKL